MAPPAESPESRASLEPGLEQNVLLELAQGLGGVNPEATYPEARGQLQALSPGALAYLGDAVFELFVRAALLFPKKRLQAYHQQVVEQVRAERQLQHLDALMPQLTPLERDIVKRGRNAAPRGPRRLKPTIYRQATGFETLIGHLYLNDPARLVELLGHVDLTAP